MFERKRYFGWTHSEINAVGEIPVGGARETLLYRADANREGLRPGETSRIITSIQFENGLFGRRIKHSLEEALRDIESLDENDFFVCPFLVEKETHEIGLVVTKNSIEIFDTGYGNNKIKILELYECIIKQYKDLNNKLLNQINYINVIQIQSRLGCAFNIKEFLLQTSECRDYNELVTKALSGEIQCTVASRTSSIMSKYTQKSGPLMVMLEDYELPPEGFLGFYLGDYKFAISIKHKKNKFFNKKKLIKTIEGDKVWFLYKDEISKTIKEFASKQQKSVVLPIETLELKQQKQIEMLTQKHKIETGLIDSTYVQSPTIDNSTNMYTLLKQYHKDVGDIEREYSQILEDIEGTKKIADLDNIVLPLDWNEGRPKFVQSQDLIYRIVKDQLKSYVERCKESSLKQTKKGLSFKSCLTEETLSANYSYMFNKALENTAKRNVESVNRDPILLEAQQKLELEHMKRIHDFEKYILTQQRNFLKSSQVSSEKERLKFEELIFLEKQRFKQNEFRNYELIGGYKLTSELFEERQRIDKELFYKRKSILENTTLSEQEKNFQIKLFVCESLKRKRDFKEKVMQELGILKDIELQDMIPILTKRTTGKAKSIPRIMKPTPKKSSLHRIYPQGVSSTMEEESDCSDYSNLTIINPGESDDWSTSVKTIKQKPSSQPPPSKHLSFTQRENLKRQQRQRSGSAPARLGY